MFLPLLLLACSAHVGEPEPSTSESAPEPVGSTTNGGLGGGVAWTGPCDRQDYVLIDGQRVSMPILCNPNADPLWDPPPDMPIVTLLPGER